MTFLLVAVLIGLLPAFIAQSKGYGFVGWWVYGAVLFIVALPHALLLKPNHAALGLQTCPSCHELVKATANVCRYCRYDLTQPARSPGAPRRPVVIGGVVIDEGFAYPPTAAPATQVASEATTQPGFGAPGGTIG